MSSQDSNVSSRENAKDQENGRCDEVREENNVKGGTKTVKLSVIL